MQPQQPTPWHQPPAAPPPPVRSSGQTFLLVLVLVLLVVNLGLTLYVFAVAKNIADATHSVTSLFGSGS